MFGDNKSGYGGLDDLINTYMGGDDSFYACGTTDGALDYAMDALNGYLKAEKPKFIHDKRSVRLEKGQNCPVCDHEIRNEFSKNAGKDYTNKCAKCGLTEESLELGTLHQLSLEEFQWAYQNDESDEIVKERAEEEGFVLALYRKIWSGEELTTAEDAKLEAIAVSQKEAIGV